MSDKKRINFIPQEERSANEISQDSLLVAFATLTILYSLGFSLHYYLGHKKLKTEFTQIQAQHQQLSSQIAILSAEEAKKQKVGDGLGELKSLVTGKSSWSEPLKELSSLIPEDVWLTESHSKGTGLSSSFVLKGSSPSQKLVGDFFSALENSYFFRSVLIKFSERDDKFYPPLYNFEFTVNVNMDILRTVKK